MPGEEVTSRQDGGAHKPEVAAAGGKWRRMGCNAPI
jgi:hypothetical protein